MTKVGESEVEYKIGKRETVYTAKKSDITIILYSDGAKDIFNSEPVAEDDEERNAPPKKKEKRAEAEETEREKRYGIRVAYNNSTVRDMDNNTGTGIGFAIGGVANFPLSGTRSINAELNLIYRKPFNLNFLGVDIDVNEWALSVPVLLKGMPFGGPVFYTEIGLQLDIPFGTTINYPGGSIDYSSRASFDFGIPFGIGWNIGEHSALGLRSVVGLTDFEGGGGQLIQGGLGLTYMF